ncbi:MAG: hypothetical protein K2O63_07295 [Alistipes sp.]|nr:hypothetical protein [Alistipes sp.]
MTRIGPHLRTLLLTLLLAGGFRGSATAQLPATLERHRSARTVVRSGLMPRTDTLARQEGADTLALTDAADVRDSLHTAAAGAPDSLGTAAPQTLPLGTDSSADRRRLRLQRRDTLSLPAMSWISLVAPGFGQIYNKQYWKLPILYGTVGAGLTLFFHENKSYRPLKRQYDALLLEGTGRTEELNDIQSRMIRSNTRRQLYLGATLASYLYFIGDAAVNYAYDTSPVRKATTLSTICPGAGQIYNKSYWKLPFVIGGLATTIYTVDWNNRGYQRFKRAYALRSAYDKTVLEAQQHPELYPDGPGQSKDEFRGQYSTEFLKNLKDNYRRNRDLCIIITAGIYILQIIDAHVDAHLKDYDISDDLSMSIAPAINYTYSPVAGGHRPTFGLNLNMNF